MRYLCSVQQQDGTWVPLWFGNQQAPAEENPLFGTSRVLRAVAAVRCCAELDAAWASAGGRGRDWLLLAQAPDGGFGANAGVPPSIEETALATEALAAWQLAERPSPEGMKSAVARGADWLAQATAGGTQFPASPIGLYFAKLWYAEQLYPVIFTAGALALAERCRT